MKRHGMPTAAPGGTIANPQRARAIELTSKGWAAIGRTPPATPTGVDATDYAAVCLCSDGRTGTIDTGVVEALSGMPVFSISNGLSRAVADDLAASWVRAVPPGVWRTAFVVRIVEQRFTPQPNEPDEGPEAGR